MSALTVGSQYRFLHTITKDGGTWDLTGAAVSLLLKKPDGTVVTKSASLFNASAGQVNYDSLTPDLDVAGNWTKAWKVVLGGVTDITTPIAFTVVASP